MTYLILIMMNLGLFLVNLWLYTQGFGVGIVGMVIMALSIGYVVGMATAEKIWMATYDD